MMSFPLTKKSKQWQNDNIVHDCNVCKRKIIAKYFKSGKHHCRKCGRIICSNCSKYKYMNHRICYDCNIILNPIHNNSLSNPYIDPNIIDTQREFSPEKNKQFEYQHQIIVKNKSKSKSKSNQSKIPKILNKSNNNKLSNTHPKPYKPPPKRINRSIPPPPPPPLPPPPPPPPLISKKRSNKNIINGQKKPKNKMDIVKNNTHKNVAVNNIDIIKNNKHKNGTINAQKSATLCQKNVTENNIDIIKNNKPKNDTINTVECGQFCQKNMSEKDEKSDEKIKENKDDIKMINKDFEKKDNNDENKDDIKIDKSESRNGKKSKKDKKRRHKSSKKRKKHKKHGKHYRNEAVTEMDDITTEIFLKLLLSFEALEEDEEKKRKKRKKRKKKSKSQRIRSKQRKTAHALNNHKSIENVTIKPSQSEAMIFVNNNVKEIKNLKPKIKPKNNRCTDEIKVIEKYEIKTKPKIKCVIAAVKKKNINGIKCGASMIKLRNKWIKLNGNSFNIRPKNYYLKKKKGKKVASKSGIYNVFAVDAFEMNEKLKFWDVMKKYNIDIYENVSDKKYYLPYLLIVNIMLPLNRNNKGLQLTFYSKLSDESIGILNSENCMSESMELFGKFIDFCMGKNNEMTDELEEAFKITVRLNNLSDTKLPFLMKKLIKRANGQSIAINENSEYYLDKSKNVFVIDIDGYNLSKSSLIMWNKVNLVLDSIQYDVGFHIGAHDVNYLPEQILLCAQINKLSVDNFTSVNRMTN